MRKLLYILLAAAATIFVAAGCAKDTPGGETVEVSFNLPFAGALSSKAVGDGSTATRLVVGVYDRKLGFVQELSVAPDDPAYAQAFQGLSAQFQTRLTVGHGYDFVFLGVTPDTDAYTIDLAAGTLTVNPRGTSNDERRDAFYGVWSTDQVTGPVQTTVTLRRPFAQFNVISSREDYENAQASLVTFQKSAFQVTAPTVLHLVDGTVDTPARYELSAAPMPTLVPNFEPYKGGGDYWLLSNYVLVGASELLEVNFALYAEGREPALYEYTIPSVPLKRNYRTIAYGGVLTTDCDFSLVIRPDYEGAL